MKIHAPVTAQYVWTNPDSLLCPFKAVTSIRCRLLDICRTNCRNFRKKINDYPIKHVIDSLAQQANDVAQCVTYAFAVRGSDVLKQKKKLSRIRCPSRVDIENLSRCLESLKGDLNQCFEKARSMKVCINDVIEISRDEKERKKIEIEEARIEIEGLNKQIRLFEQDIQKYEDDARTEERGAEELENRARYLRHEAEQHTEKGALWGFLSTAVGLVFAPFTAGASLVAGIASAGIGMAVKFNDAIDCARNAATLRVSAANKRAKAERQKKMKEELEMKILEKRYKLERRKTMVENLTTTCDELMELERHLQGSFSGLERAIMIVQGFQNAAHLTELQGYSFSLLKDFFIESPDEFHDEAHEELGDLKVKWKELEQLFILFSDRQGITF